MDIRLFGESLVLIFMAVIYRRLNETERGGALRILGNVLCADFTLALHFLHSFCIVYVLHFGHFFKFIFLRLHRIRNRFLLLFFLIFLKYFPFVFYLV